MSTELFSINENPQPGEKKVKLTDGFDQYAASQGLSKESIKYTKSTIEVYWNNYLNTGGKVEFARKSILGSIERELGRAKSDLQKSSVALPVATLDKSTSNMANNPGVNTGKSGEVASIVNTVSGGGLVKVIGNRTNMINSI